MNIALRLLILLIALATASCASTIVTVARYVERGGASLEEKSVTISNHTIFYLEGGTGETILLVHGFSADKDNWTRFSKYLTKRYHVVALDLPGFGESSRVGSESYSIENQVKRLHQFSQSLGLKKFHIAGNSMGGSISGVYASEFPEDVLSVGLLAPAGVTSPQDSKFMAELRKGNNPLIVNSMSEYDRMLAFVFVEEPYIPGPAREYFAQIAMNHRDFNEKIFQEIKWDLSLEAKMKGIQAKTLVIWGDMDRVLDASGSLVLEKGIRNVKTIIMKNCGHVPMIERPEETAKYYLEFIGS